MSDSRGYQKCILKMESWTHVHIGSGRTIGRWEYFVKDGKLYLLDYNKLSLVAARHPGFIESLTKAAQEGGDSSLHTFLSEHPDFRDQIGNNPRGLPRELRNAAKKLTELKLFAGSPRCYIPGSSLKGTLRTPYIAKQVCDGKITLSRDRRELSQNLAEGFQLNSLDNKMFQHIILRDSAFFRSSDMAVASVKIFADSERKQQSKAPSRRGDFNRRSPTKNHDTFCEVLLCETKFDLEIMLRVGHLRDKPIKSITELLKSADEFYRRVWDEEKVNRANSDGPDSKIAEFYRNPGCHPPADKYVLRIGHGSGQMATSILLDYKDKYKNEKNADEPLRVGPAYQRGPERKRTRSPYPYTAKSAVAADIDERQPLGWVTIDKNLEVNDVN